jgi:hypothetical protein
MYDSAELPHVLVVGMVGSILSRPAVSFSAHVHAEERLVQVLTGFRESGVYIPEPGPEPRPVRICGVGTCCTNVDSREAL